MSYTGINKAKIKKGTAYAAPYDLAAKTSGQASVLERYIVVDEAVVLGTAGRLAAAGGGLGRGGPLVTPAAPRRAAAEHLHLSGYDLGGVACNSFLFPGPCAQVPFNIDEIAFVKIFLGDFSQPSP